MKSVSLACAVVTLVTALQAPVFAQDTRWPNPKQVIKIVVPTLAGGGTDIFGRLLATKLHDSLGATFIVENKPGATGTIGTVQVKFARPNGETLLFTQSSFTSNVPFFKNLPYDPVGDFAPVALIGSQAYLVCVNSSSPVKSMRELIAYARAKFDGITYASGGLGTTPHLAGELFKARTGLKMVHVPYRGTTPAVTDLISGVIDTVFTTEHSILPHVEAGKARCLATTGRKRSPYLPHIATVAEAAQLPGYEIGAWYGLFGPASLPRPVIDTLNQEVNRVLGDPEAVKKYFAPVGLVVDPTTPERFLELIKADVQLYLKLAQDANVTPQ
jgi:tripartite-type tricarboxylate transporter receptor subunit TctC